MNAYLALAVGVVALGATVYFRRGHGPGARWWVDDETYARWGTSAGVVMGALPAIGGIAIALFLGELGDTASALGGLLLIVSVLVGLVGMVVPRALGPRWWRREQAALRDRQRSRRPR